MKQLQGRLAHSESLGANQWPTVRVRPPTSAGRQAPALSFASTAMPAPVRGPQLPWSLDTPEGGGVEVKDLVTFSVCPMSLSTPPEAQVAMVPGPLFENQSGGASASERAWGSRGPRGESGDLLVQALGDFSWPPVTEGARSLRPWSQRGQPSG